MKYINTLKYLNERLELRRLRADLLMCYKILHHFVDIPQDDCFTISHVKITRENSYKLFVSNSRVDARAYFFSVRIITVRHRLSDVIVASSISSFYNKIVKADLSFAIIGKHQQVIKCCHYLVILFCLCVLCLAIIITVY